MSHEEDGGPGILSNGDLTQKLRKMRHRTNTIATETTASGRGNENAMVEASYVNAASGGRDKMLK